MSNSEDSLERQQKRLRLMDELSSFTTTSLPPLWRGLYMNLLSEGFSEPEALSLLKCYILRDGHNGVHIHKD